MDSAIEQTDGNDAKKSLTTPDTDGILEEAICQPRAEEDALLGDEKELVQEDYLGLPLLLATTVLCQIVFLPLVHKPTASYAVYALISLPGPLIGFTVYGPAIFKTSRLLFLTLLAAIFMAVVGEQHVIRAMFKFKLAFMVKMIEDQSQLVDKAQAIQFFTKSFQGMSDETECVVIALTVVLLITLTVSIMALIERRAVGSGSDFEAVHEQGSDSAMVDDEADLLAGDLYSGYQITYTRANGAIKTNNREPAASVWGEPLILPSYPPTPSFSSSEGQRGFVAVEKLCHELEKPATLDVKVEV